MHSSLHRLKNSQGLLSIVVLGSGNIVGTIISAIALILFSRFLGPTDFGIFSAAFAAMQICVRLADMGINIAAERSISRIYKQDEVEADRQIRAIMWFKLVVTTLIVFIGWLISPWLSRQILHIEDIEIIRYAILLSVGTVFFEFTTLIFQATEKFGQVARITIAQATAKLIVGLFLIWQNALTTMTALVVYGLMPLLGGLAGWWPMSPISSLKLPQAWKASISSIIVVAKWTSIAAISATLADNIDVLMIKSFMTSFDTGLWSAAARIAAFASVVGWSIGSVLNNRVAKYNDKEHLDSYLSKAWKLAIGVFALIAVTIPLSKLAILITVGSSYLEGTPALGLLLLSSALAASTAPFVALFYLFDKPQYYAYAGILQTVILLAGDYFLIPPLGIIGAAYVRIIVRVVILLFTLYYARLAYREKYA